MQWVYGFVLLVLLACGGGVESAWAAEPGETFQLCTCLGTMDDAHRLVVEMQGVVPGLEAMIQPRKIDGRAVFEIWVWHPEMTSRQLCSALGQASCAAAQSECEGSGMSVQ